MPQPAHAPHSLCPLCLHLTLTLPGKPHRKESLLCGLPKEVRLTGRNSGLCLCDLCDQTSTNGRLRSVVFGRGPEVRCAPRHPERVASSWSKRPHSAPLCSKGRSRRRFLLLCPRGRRPRLDSCSCRHRRGWSHPRVLHYQPVQHHSRSWHARTASRARQLRLGARSLLDVPHVWCIWVRSVAPFSLLDQSAHRMS